MLSGSLAGLNAVKGVLAKSYLPMSKFVSAVFGNSCMSVSG